MDGARDAIERAVAANVRHRPVTIGSDDVAFAQRWLAQLRSDEHARDRHYFPRTPDRRSRVQAFIDACGGLPGFDVQRNWVADATDA